MRDDGGTTTEDWRRVAEVVEARLIALGLTQRQAGASPTTIRRLINEYRPIVRRDARAALCQALGWAPDAIDRILNGQDPVELIPSDESERLADLEVRFAVLEDRIEKLLDVLRPAAAESARPRERQPD